MNNPELQACKRVMPCLGECYCTEITWPVEMITSLENQISYSCKVDAIAKLILGVAFVSNSSMMTQSELGRLSSV